MNQRELLLYNQLIRMIEDRGFTVSYIAPPPGTPEDSGWHATTDFTDRIVTLSTQDRGAKALDTVAHELAHIILDHPNRLNGLILTQRAQGEIEAQLTAFYVLQHHDIDNRPQTEKYVGSWLYTCGATKEWQVKSIVSKAALAARNAKAEIVSAL